ncbi:alpha/beta fold hydrolase [Nakamurella flavida]|uniref:Alpha/beta fold hydrolase n=1 Tax=Nakamurella flavida TaxID=363630 RepID=A0A939C356_9ACTN|nr:alpha/beta hydrolase family protein [Nakamurella flavida]MBM9477285.1 alpha/beta fold hydrolase [Nakamurella flavida]MDP9779741.1 pimeloyl-ACP methyl ester carboxylesterase [Nakamurella flavida]
MVFSAIHDLLIDEKEVRVHSNGTGRPILMLHDLGSSAASWEHMTAEVVAAGREVVAIDLPGAGHSDAVEGLAEQVHHLHEVVLHVAPEPTDPIDLVGHGFGGYLAVSLAATHPEQVSGLVLEDPTLPPRSGPPVRARMPPAMAVSGALTTLRRGRLRENIGGFARARAALDQLAQADAAWWGRLSRVTAPTFIIGTGVAKAGDRALLDLLETAIVPSTRTDLPDARRGHLSDPDSFAAMVVGFLR